MQYENLDRTAAVRPAASTACFTEVWQNSYKTEQRTAPAAVTLPDVSIDMPGVNDRHHRPSDATLAATAVGEKVDSTARQQHIEGEIAVAKQNGVPDPEKYVASERKRLEDAYAKDPDSIEKERKELEQKMKDGKMSESEQVTLFMIYDIESEHYQARAK